MCLGVPGKIIEIYESGGLHMARIDFGGLATSLKEIAGQSGVCVLLPEDRIPVRLEVAAASEMLGFDPLYIANEGRLLVIVSPEGADDVLAARYGKGAVRIWEVLAAPAGRVLMKTAFGSTRVVGMLMGEMLPRIC